MVGLRLGRQLGDDPGIGLAAAQQEGPHEPGEPLDGLLVLDLLVVLDRAGVPGAEGLERAEETGGGPVEERPEFGEVVLHGSAGEGDPGGCGDLAQRLRGRGERVLDVLGLVGDDHPPLAAGQLGGAGPQRAVGREDEASLDGVEVALGSVEAPHGHVGGEPPHLALPVAEQGRRADDEGGGAAGAAQMEGDEGDGLAEAHVVGETAAESERGHQVQPGEAAQLVVAEGGGEAGRRLHVLGAA